MSGDHNMYGDGNGYGDGKSADCLREMYGLLQRCENEMRYAGWDKLESDNYVRNDVYQEVKSILEKNT